MQSEGPRKIHRSIRDIDKATHTLHIDIAGPFAPSDDGYSYFLVGALRLPGFPLLIDVRTLTSRTSTEVCDELEKMVAYLEALQTEGLPIGETSRIKRLHSDRAGEFTAPFFARFLGNHKSIHHSFTSGYDPQSNGTAERSVGLIKSLASRALATAELDSSYWSYAVRYASQSLLCHALQKKQRSLPFGTTVVAQVLGHRDVRFPSFRSITGRLLYFDHLNDQVSYILCPPGDDSIEPLVHRAGLPAKLPPAVNIDELAGPDPLPSSFDKPLRDPYFDDKLSKDPLDLDPLPSDSPPQLHDNDAHNDKSDDFAKDQERSRTYNDRQEEENDDSDDDDVLLEFSLSEVYSSLPDECPFTFLYLSSEDSTKDDAVDEDVQDCSLPNAPSTKQGTSHVPFTAEEVLRSNGQERKGWIDAGRTELNNLTGTGTTTNLSPEQKEELRKNAKATGQKYIELPAMAVFTQKPDKKKVRIVACGNKTDEVFGKTTTTDLDCGMMRYIISWAASLPDFSLATLDVTAAFLNAPLPAGRIVVLRPPTILYKLKLLPQGHVWLVHKAIYGLREAPSLWSEERTDALTNLTFASEGESYAVILSQVHKSLCLIVKQQSLQDHSPTTDAFGLTSRVLPDQVVALSGIYVDDFLTAGPPQVVRSFLAALRKMWRTSDPQFLSLDADLPFLGVSIRMTKNGILLHQHHYTQDLLHNHSSHISARKRNTSGEPTHFQKDPPLPPDPTNSEHQRWIKIGQKILGGLLWLSTRTRPDLAFAVSSAAQVLTKDIELLKVKLRHLLQYLSTTQTLALLYPYPRDREMTDFAVFSDSSFAPSGKHSQSGYTIHLSFANTRHLIHWQSLRESKIAESSAEAELYALATARKFARNFRLLIQESFATSIVMSLRCDNTAAISMLEEPGWRTRYISIYAEAIRQEMQQRTLTLTYVSTEHQLADPLTKPTSALVNSIIFPQWGLVRFCP